VINLDPEICRRIREARREAGLSQSVLAAEVGCKQSALSMFEQGDGTKLNDEAIEKLAEKFGISLKKESSPVSSAVVFSPREKGTAFCPNPDCPGNHGYNVGAEILFRPDRTAQDPAGGKFCALCGEVLESKCPNCGAAVHDGGVCSFCGKPYVSKAVR
jgi:transcriptional regulator with XRE-family HTH domain